MPQIIALGLVELNSIAKGILASDAMLKRSDVQIIESYPVCPGKYIILVSGDVAAVDASVKAGTETAGIHFVDQIIIPHVHPQVLPGLLGTSRIRALSAVGVLETFSVASAILAADTSLKAARVDMIEIRIAKGLGGKSFYTLTGSVADVRTAIEAGALTAEKEGVLVGKEIIPEPHPDLKQQLLEW